MNRLELIKVNIGKLGGIDTYLSVGFRVLTTEKIKIDIFSIDEIYSKYFINNAPTVCQNIIEQVSLNESINDVEWTYTAAPAYSKIEFKALNGFAVIMKFENGEVANNYYGGRSLDHYKEALNDLRGFEVALQDGYPDHLTFTSAPLIRYLAYTPIRSQEIHVMERPYINFSLENYPVVFVDTELFITYWRRQCCSNRFHKLKNLVKGNVDTLDIDDMKLLQSTHETSLKYSIPYQMASDVCLDFENKIRFGGGRHRVVNLANSGAPFIPVQTFKNGLNTFCKLFEWKPAKT